MDVDGSFLPVGEMTFKYSDGLESNVIETYWKLTANECTFGYKVNGTIKNKETWRTIRGDPSAWTIPSIRNGPNIKECYPDVTTRLRFVKNLLGVWCAVRFAIDGLLGPYGNLLLERPEIEDYWNKEMVSIVIIPTLRSIYEARRYLQNISQSIIHFCDQNYREMDNFLIYELDEVPITNESKFQEDFRHKLRQITASVNIRAIQSMQTAHIDQLADMGHAVEELKKVMDGLPEYRQYASTLETIQTSQKLLKKQIEEIDNSDCSKQIDDLSQEIQKLKGHLSEISDIRLIIDTLKKEIMKNSTSTEESSYIEELKCKINRIESSMLKNEDYQSQFSELLNNIHELKSNASKVVTENTLNTIVQNLETSNHALKNELRNHHGNVLQELQDMRKKLHEQEERIQKYETPKKETTVSPDETIILASAVLSRKQRAILERMHI